MEKLISYPAKALAAVGSFINAVKDGYLKAVQWVVDHPHRTIWAAVGVIVALLVLK